MEGDISLAYYFSFGAFLRNFSSLLAAEA